MVVAQRQLTPTGGICYTVGTLMPALDYQWFRLRPQKANTITFATVGMTSGTYPSGQ